MNRHCAAYPALACYCPDDTTRRRCQVTAGFGALTGALQPGPEGICWNCGQPGTSPGGYFWKCEPCQVTWMPWPFSGGAFQDAVWWRGTRLPLVDFTQPGAPPCPA